MKKTVIKSESTRDTKAVVTFLTKLAGDDDLVESVSEAEAQIDALVSIIVSNLFEVESHMEQSFKLDYCVQILADEKLVNRSLVQQAVNVLEQLQDPYDDEDFDGESIAWFVEDITKQLKGTIPNEGFFPELS